MPCCYHVVTLSVNKVKTARALPSGCTTKIEMERSTTDDRQTSNYLKCDGRVEHDAQRQHDADSLVIVAVAVASDGGRRGEGGGCGCGGPRAVNVVAGKDSLAVGSVVEAAVVAAWLLGAPEKSQTKVKR